MILTAQEFKLENYFANYNWKIFSTFMEMHQKIIVHLPDLLTEKISPLMKQEFLKIIESEIIDERIAVPARGWEYTNAL